ncbi:PREDICTED: uncharacterized protein LOC105312116 [Amphimedon queenslandica]|uniref:Uncharacterized protein n=1 Tax=Amphimedon queenslandica TaxID=400682 RepID=A0A1X7VU91_AMPQE|nr:PREDICTED: uncharacterized protein LOC105312116 [Amphimedon queenslandica]|eukprot:XP_011402805.2 PREDICTED: uncharacterized protein LOC105312116 [Amphimedon queenslandica]
MASLSEEKITLFNFEHPKFKETRYVLTSPRSLRACANLGLKPSELLPQSLDEFSVSEQTRPLKGSYLTAAYENFERERRTKLLKARKERHRIASNMQSDSNGVSRSITQPAPVGSSLLKDSTGRESEFFQFVQHPPATAAHYIPVKDQKILNGLMIRREQELSGGINCLSNSLKQERALSNKEILDETKHFNIKMRNATKETEFKKNKSFLEEESRLKEERLKAMVRHKDEKAESNIEMQQSIRRDKERWRKEKQRLKEIQVRLKTASMAAELEDWCHHVDKQNRTSITKASEASQRQLLQKKYHLQQKRHEKEMNHSKAMKKLSREEEKAREYSVKEIATKYERMDSIAKQKAEELSQSLMIAQHTAQLRDSIKGSYLSANLFKEGEKHARQYTALEGTSKKRLRHSWDPIHHQSTVVLG